MDHTHARTVIENTLANTDAIALVADYFATPSGDRQGFSGAWFQRLGGGGDSPNVADEFTATDLVAVTMLSVQVPPLAAKVLLEERQDAFSALLGGIDPEETIETEAGKQQLRNPDSAANRLWHELKDLHGVGWVTAGKLLARKRPALVPVWDDVVRTYLGAPAGAWAFFADLFDDPATVERLTTIRGESGATHASLLRVLDVLLWCSGKGHDIAEGPE